MVTQSDMARVERSLSPQQAALHFYTPVLWAETPAAYAVALYDALEADPLDRRLQRIDGATVAALRGASREAVEKAQRDARLEHYFVCRLIDTANQHALRPEPHN